MRFPAASGEQAAEIASVLAAEAVRNRCLLPQHDYCSSEQSAHAPALSSVKLDTASQFFGMVASFKMKPDSVTGGNSLQQPAGYDMTNTPSVVAPSQQSFSNGTCCEVRLREHAGQSCTVWGQQLPPKGYDDGCSSCCFADDRGVSCDPNSLELYIAAPDCFNAPTAAGRYPPTASSLQSTYPATPICPDSACTRTDDQTVRDLSDFLFGPVVSASSRRQCNQPGAPCSPQCSLASEQSLDYLQTSACQPYSCLPQVPEPTWQDSWQHRTAISEQTGLSDSAHDRNPQQLDVNCNCDTNKTNCNFAPHDQGPAAVMKSFSSKYADQKDALGSASSWTKDMSLTLNYWSIEDALTDPVVVSAETDSCIELAHPSCSVAEQDTTQGLQQRAESAQLAISGRAGPGEADVTGQRPAAFSDAERGTNRSAVSCAVKLEPRQSSSGDHDLAPKAEGQPEELSRTREQQLQRYRDKKVKRLLQPAVRYKLRKANADQRPRIKGRFVKKHEEAAARQLAAMEKLSAAPPTPGTNSSR